MHPALVVLAVLYPVFILGLLAAVYAARDGEPDDGEQSNGRGN